MDNTSKSQVLEKLKSAQNVLITVSANPSLDQLSAAIGATLLLNKAGKHATAVFSGQVPEMLEFLKPEDTFEKNTDSLRDFIISLDKAKADKLRYKVEDNVVRIFITPYRTSLSSKDLVFTDGDFNVDVVLALGVDKKEHLDNAVMAQSRILHDATVIGFMAGKLPIDTGSINWQDEKASSLSEMFMSISDTFGENMVDAQIATAFLTGIVSETERFSNDKTTPQVMSMSAQLMNAGANQQLISTELSVEEVNQVPASLPEPSFDGLTEIPHAESNSPAVAMPMAQPAAPSQSPAPEVAPTTQFMMPPPLAQPAPQPQNTALDQIKIDEQGNFINNDDARNGDAVLASAQTMMPEHHEMTLTPPAQPSPETYSKFMTQPPISGGTLTASNTDEVLEPSLDALSGTLPSQAPGVVGQAPVANTSSAIDSDAARKAVLDAVNSVGYDTNRPEPLQSIGAQMLDEVQHTAAPAQSAPQEPAQQMAPPMVPPPLPLPDQNTI
jgi:hypothetical protein